VPEDGGKESDGFWGKMFWPFSCVNKPNEGGVCVICEGKGSEGDAKAEFASLCGIDVLGITFEGGGASNGVDEDCNGEGICRPAKFVAGWVCIDEVAEDGT